MNPEQQSQSSLIPQKKLIKYGLISGWYYEVKAAMIFRRERSKSSWIYILSKISTNCGRRVHLDQNFIHIHLPNNTHKQAFLPCNERTLYITQRLCLVLYFDLSLKYFFIINLIYSYNITPQVNYVCMEEIFSAVFFSLPFHFHNFLEVMEVLKRFSKYWYELFGLYKKYSMIYIF